MEFTTCLVACCQINCKVVQFFFTEMARGNYICATVAFSHAISRAPLKVVSKNAKRFKWLHSVRKESSSKQGKLGGFVGLLERFSICAVVS